MPLDLHLLTMMKFIINHYRTFLERMPYIHTGCHVQGPCKSQVVTFCKWNQRENDR